MLTTLWNQPELLRAFFQKVMELHSDNPDFYERMRVDFISYRAPSEIFYWQGEKNKAASQPETDQIKIEQCDVAIKAIEGLLRDALSKQDLWSPIAV
jgi:hypothetical protein